MPVQFKIRITKDIIYESRNCGADKDICNIGSNCAIAIALQNVFPEVYVTNHYIFPFGIDIKHLKITLPVIAQQFVKLFDGFRVMPKLRLLLPEFEFVVDIPDEIIGAINIDEIKMLASTCKQTAALV